jgi:hypothetical protein
MKIIQLEQLNLKLLLGVLELAVGVLPARRGCVAGGLFARRSILFFGAEGHGQTPYVGGVSNVGDPDWGGLLEGHPEGRLLCEGHIVEGLDVEAHGLAEGELLGTDALKIPVS